jgi:protein subunit release factor B
LIYISGAWFSIAVTLARLASLFIDEKAAKEQQSRSELRQSHWELERGNPVRVYDGLTMKQIKRKNNDG